jgi:hypothetical protein
MIVKHIVGKKTSRKIIVFESDDWGSFRFKNKAIRDHYMPKPKLGQWMHYNDCFESFEDLVSLENVLNSVKDKNGNSACFTFLMNPANPDFEKIETHNFKAYYYETFSQSLQNRKDGLQILNWYKVAIKNRLIEIGFHGREHLNVHSWMNALANGNEIVKDGFKNRIWGQAKLHTKEKKMSFRSTFSIENKSELEYLKISIKEGLDVMCKTFDRKPTYFLPPDGPYHLALNKTLAENGIKYIGLAKLHNNPLEPKWYQTKPFWLGKKTKEGLCVITRNVMFEPSSPKHNDWVNFGLQQIEEAFKYRNPAVISTHRANYMSGLNFNNREQALVQLKELLRQITKKWPHVEFMTSSQLGETIAAG